MPKKVLIIEDSRLQARLYYPVFAKYPGCRLLFALNGAEAMDILAREKDIDLIILDLYMPKMDGYSFLKTWHPGDDRNIPVIVVSSEHHDREICRMLEAGASAYVTKPWATGNVRRIVDLVISKTRLGN